MSVRLGVNIDHIAAFRAAGGQEGPDIMAAARECLSSGADFICAGRTFLQDKDLAQLANELKTGFCLLTPCTKDFEKAVLKMRPSQVCLFSGGREHALHLKLKEADALAAPVGKLKKAGIEAVLYIAPDAEAVRNAHRAGADAVCLCSSIYGAARTQKQQVAALEDIAVAAVLARELGLDIYVSGGLDYRNTKAVASIDGVKGVLSGFSVISRSIFSGLSAAVLEFKELTVCAA